MPGAQNALHLYISPLLTKVWAESSECGVEADWSFPQHFSSVPLYLSLYSAPRGARPIGSRPRAEPVLLKLLTVINGLGWGFEGVPYGCLLISFKWNQSAALERGKKCGFKNGFSAL